MGTSPNPFAGAGTWIGNIEEAIKFCNSIQEFYWKTILKIPDSCPKLALRCETFSKAMKWRIWEEKCLLLNRVQNLEEGSLAKKIYEQAENQGWPGLGRDVQDICIQIDIPNMNTHKISKSDFKKAINQSHHEDMMRNFDSSRKLQDIKNSDFSKLQPYFNDRSIENARTKFKIRTKMLENMPGNMHKNVENGLKCDLCPDEMTQNHCVLCPGRMIEREGLDMNDLDDLVIYFSNILDRRRR